MVAIYVILDEKDHNWKMPQKDGVYHAMLAIPHFDLTDQEIEQHATTLAKMLLKSLQEPN